MKEQQDEMWGSNFLLTPQQMQKWIDAKVERDALLKLVEAYRDGCTNDDGDCCHGQVNYCTAHNECLLYKAEKEYEKTIKRQS